MTHDDATFQQQLSMLRKQVDAMVRDIRNNTERLDRSEDRLNGYDRALYGSEREDTIGLLKEMKSIKEDVRTIKTDRTSDRRAQKQWFIGIALGVGISSADSLASIVWSFVQYIP